MTDLELIDHLIANKVVQDTCKINSIEMHFKLITNIERQKLKLIIDITHEFYITSQSELIVTRKTKGGG